MAVREGTCPELLEVQVTSKRWSREHRVRAQRHPPPCVTLCVYLGHGPPGYPVRGTFSRRPFVTYRYPPLILHIRERGDEAGGNTAGYEA